MLLAINPATIAVLPVVASGCYLLYKLWAPQRDRDGAPTIEVIQSHQAGEAGFNYPDYGSTSDHDRAHNAVASSGLSITEENLEKISLARTGDQEIGVEQEPAAPHSDFTLDGLFVESPSSNDDHLPGHLEADSAEEVNNVSRDESKVTENNQGERENSPQKPEGKQRERRRSKNKLAQFPFDIRVWEDPGTPRSVARAQRRAERAERRAALEETRVAVTDAVAGGGGSVVLAAPVEIPREMFADVWQLASGEAAPDAMSDAATSEDKASKRAAERAAKKAEREERKLERLRSKEEKRRQRDPETDDSASFMETEDPWIEGSGENAFLTVSDEVGDPVAWDSDEEKPLPETWEIGDNDFTSDAATSEDKASKRAAERAAKKAEREERKLERLRSKEEKRRQRDPETDDSASFMETEDPWIEGSGENAFLTVSDEVGDPVAWDSDEEKPLPETWEIGGVGEGLGEASMTWAEAAAASGPVVPSATMITGDELLDLGSSIVIGTEPGAGDGAFYLPEGFETVEEPETRRGVLRRRRRNEDIDESAVESVSDWAQGGVVLDPDEGVNYQDYDIPEPIPSRTVVIFGESEES